VPGSVELRINRVCATETSVSGVSRERSVTYVVDCWHETSVSGVCHRWPGDCDVVAAYVW
jgi:hypothetical protein